MTTRESGSAEAPEPAVAGSEPGRAGLHRLLLVLPAAAFVILVLVLGREPAIPQPITFSHLKHSTDLELACEFCHQYVNVGAHAGLPGGEICAYCHLAPQGKSADAARLTDLLNAGTPFRFNKLFRLPDHVYYTHGRHVGVAELECVNCHGGIATTERPPQRALVRIDMDFCLDCHRANGQTLDCNACHR